MKKNDVENSLFKIAKKLRGLQTVSTISKKLNIKKRTAINYAWKLRKKGYLTTYAGGSKVRIYQISPIKYKKKGGYSLYELLNKNTKVKINFKEDYIIHSKEKPCIEEILARCIASKNFRIVLASLGLFNKIKNWSKLKHFADKYKIGKKVGGLYDIARTVMRVKRMDKRTKKSLLKSKGSSYIIKYAKTKDFKDIEKKWKVKIPFNKADLEKYKEW